VLTKKPVLEKNKQEQLSILGSNDVNAIRILKKISYTVSLKSMQLRGWISVCEYIR